MTGEKNGGIDPQQEADLLGLADADSVGSSGAGVGDFDARGHIEQLNQAAAEMPSSELFQSVFAGVGAVASTRYGGHWALSDEESAVMGVAVGDVFDKYMPDFKAGPEVALVMVSMTVFLPKYAAHRSIAANSKGGEHGDKSEPGAQ